MEKRALVALALSFLVFILFIYFGDKVRPPSTPVAPPPLAEVKPATPAPASAPAAAPSPGRGLRCLQ